MLLVCLRQRLFNLVCLNPREFIWQILQLNNESLKRDKLIIIKREIGKRVQADLPKTELPKISNLNCRKLNISKCFVLR